MPSDRRMDKDAVHIYPVEHYSATERAKHHLQQHGWARRLPYEVNQKDKYHDLTSTWNQNMTQMNLSKKQKQTHRHREQTCECQGGEG